MLSARIVPLLESYLDFVFHPLVWIFIGLTVVFYAVQGVVGQSSETPTAPDDRIKGIAKRVGMEGLHPTVFLLLALTWGIVAATLFAGLYVILIQVIFHAQPDGEKAVWDWRFTLAQLAALTTVLGAVIALPITINRLILTRRQTDTVEQGHITDRINKAVEGLGATKLTKTVLETPRYRKKNGEWIRDENGNPAPAKRPDGQDIIDREVIETSEPNLEVRIGAIYALERISQDSARDHIQIMEILCAYIRENAPVSSAFEIDVDSIFEESMKALGASLKEKGGPRQRFGGVRSPIDLETKKIQFPRQDIQTAISVIGRNRKGGKEGAVSSDGHSSQLDLRRCNLQRVEFGEGDFSNFSFFGCALDAANFSGCNLGRANLQQSSANATWFHNANCEGMEISDSKIMGAIFTGANLCEAHLSGTFAVGAYFVNAYSKNVDLYGANMRFALCWNTNFAGSEFIKTDLRATNFKSSNCGRVRFEKCQQSKETIFSNAIFEFANFRRQDLSGLALTQDQIDTSFGDASVILPGGHGPNHESWPAHWATLMLGDDQFQNEWRKWQADPENYVPPVAPDEA